MMVGQHTERIRNLMFVYHVPDHIDPFWETEERGKYIPREEAPLYLKHQIPVAVSYGLTRAAAKYRVWEKRLTMRGVL